MVSLDILTPLLVMPTTITSMTTTTVTLLKVATSPSQWFYADQDMPAYSSLMSSKYLPWYGNDGNQWSFQLDVNGNDKIRWRSAQGSSSR